MKRCLIILVFFYSTLFAVNMTQEKLVSNYIFNFSLHTLWPEGIKGDSFEIYLLSSNKNLSSTFKNLIKSQKLHGKKIVIRQGTKSSIPYTANVVYVDTEFLKEYKKVYSSLEGRPVLIVSNAYDNKRLVMMNLLHEKNKSIHFEINKANILNQGLSLDPKIILLGGTELDVAKLYKGAKDSLLQKEQELQKQIQKAKKLGIEIKNSKKTNEFLQKEIKNRNSELSVTQKKLTNLHTEQKKLQDNVLRIAEQLEREKETLASEKASTQKIRNDYAKANQQLDAMSFKLLSQKEKLNKQEKEVKEKEDKLTILTQKVAKKAVEFKTLQKSLATQKVKIQNQGEKIDIQQDILLVLTIAALIFLILIFIIYKTLRRENKTNTALKQTQEALKEQVEKTVKANASKTKFLAHMSHELRTPLNAVLGYCQLLQKDPKMSDANQNTLAIINRSGEHLLALINDVLEVSKIETGHIDLDSVSFDLSQFLDDVYMMFATRMSEESLNLELIKDKDLPQFICADINKVRQILINILGNSIKFTALGGIIIRVGHDAVKSELLIEIEDSGEGIAEDEIAKLFQPFKQTISGKLGGGGAGLGLSIVQEYIQIMGGKIEVKSKLAFGTIFYLRIPFEQADMNEIEHKESANVVSLSEKDRGLEVLIADDNKINNQLLSDTLTRVGFKVSSVENGLEALRLFKKNHYKLVLLDIEMPIMNGYVAAKSIRKLENTDDTSIIAVTANIFDTDKKKAFESGFSAIVRKPFKDYELFDEIKKSVNIDYIYEKEDKYKPREKVILKDIDKSYKEELIKAASRMKISVINDIIVQIQEEFPKEAMYMKKLAEKFDYETLIKLLKEE